MTFDGKTGQWRQGRSVLYVTRTLLEHDYVGKADDGQLYLFAGVPGGWAARRPYHGHADGLRRVAPETARLVCEAAGADFDGWRVLEGWIVED